MNRTKYNIYKVHEPKSIFERNNGKIVTAIMDVIGSVMVSDNKIVPFIVQNLNWVRHIQPMFYDICVNHFEVKPIKKTQFTWMIEGYSSEIKIYSYDKFLKEEYYLFRGYNFTSPVFDLNYNGNE